MLFVDMPAAIGLHHYKVKRPLLIFISIGGRVGGKESFPFKHKHHSEHATCLDDSMCERVVKTTMIISIGGL